MRVGDGAVRRLLRGGDDEIAHRTTLEGGGLFQRRQRFRRDARFQPGDPVASSQGVNSVVVGRRIPSHVDSSP